MSISGKDQRLLYQRSGNRCAFPNCPRSLTAPATDSDDDANLSEVAHIVAQSEDGPRGKFPLPMEERDKYPNLILMCGEHHTRIDRQPNHYTVEMLRQMKRDHEQKVDDAVARTVTTIVTPSQDWRKDVVYSTLLPVMQMPRYMYGATCDFRDSQEKELAKKIVVGDSRNLYPFILRSKTLFCFQDLREKNNAFREIIKPSNAQRFDTREFPVGSEIMNWYVALLNRTLNKMTGRKGLNWDREHKRYYFQADGSGKPVEIFYRPLNKDSTKCSVVWRPITKKTGQPKNYWCHKAVGLRFINVSLDKWCLSVRPEMRFTKDGVTPIESKTVGSKSTRKRSRMHNDGLLTEVQFWRDFLGDGNPRILLHFDEKNSLAISTDLMQTEVNWPGIPDAFAKQFTNVVAPENLFSNMEWEDFLANSAEDDWEDGEDDDEE